MPSAESYCTLMPSVAALHLCVMNMKNILILILNLKSFPWCTAPGPERSSITSGVRTVRRRADVVVTDHRGLGFAGEVAARGLVEGPAAGGAVT